MFCPSIDRGFFLNFHTFSTSWTLIINNIISGGSLHELQILGREFFKLHHMDQFVLSDFQWTWEVKRALQTQCYECLNRDYVNFNFFALSCYVNPKIVYISISLCHWRFRILEMREVEVSFFDLYLSMWYQINQRGVVRKSRYGYFQYINLILVWLDIYVWR